MRDLEYWTGLHRKHSDGIGLFAFGVATGLKMAQRNGLMTNTITPAEKEAVEHGRGVIKNGRYFNTGKTYDADGRLRYDFDASNARDPWFNGGTFHGYDEQGCPIWNKAT